MVESNVSYLYSCFDGHLSRNEVTSRFWTNQEHTTAALVHAVLTLVFFMVALPSNLLIILSMVWQRLYKEPTHILLLNLAISDLLLCVLVMPFTIAAGLAGEYIFGGSDYTRCRVCQMGVIFTILTVFSVHVLAMISLDRCLFIKLSFRYEAHVTMKRTVGVVATLWLLSILFSLPPLFGFGDIDYTFPISTCTPRFEYSTTLTKNIYYILFVVLECLLPIGLIVVTNAWLVCIVRRHLAKLRQEVSTSSDSKQNWKKYKESLKEGVSSARNRKHLRLMVVFGVILAANLVTWIPLIVRSVVSLVYGSDDILPGWTVVLVYLCLVSHSFLHPLIQASLIPEVRKFSISLLVKCLSLNNCKAVGVVLVARSQQSPV